MITHWSNMDVNDRITRARIQSYQKSAFFSYILLHMKLQEDTKGVLPKDNQTMGIDVNGNMYYSPEWVKTLSEDELVGVLTHEAMHKALLHLERLGSRNPRVFNLANDILVNYNLVNSGYTLPKNGCIPLNDIFEILALNLKIENIGTKSSEEIYDELMKNKGIGRWGEGQGKGKIIIVPGKGKGQKLTQEELDELLKGFDVHIYDGKDGEEQTEDEKATKQGEWKKIIAEAMQLAKQQGKMPAGFERMIEDILDSKMNWKEKLYKYVVDTIPFDFSWARPSKKFMSLGIYMPHVLKESVKIVTSVDTSGSIGKEEISEFLGELLGIAESFANIDVDVIVCDAEVHETYTLTKNNIDDILSMKMSGGGGTSHQGVIKHVLDNIQDARVLIAFTDGYSDINQIDHSELPFDVLWCISKGGVTTDQIEWGDVIKLE